MKISKDDAAQNLNFMKLAIAEAKKSKLDGGKTPLYVGAVVVKNGNLLASACRGEISEGEHAEYTTLERKLVGVDLTGATLYTTLEPCTTRNHPKIPCAKRIVKRKIGKVVVGILDPNPDIRGNGVWILTDSGIRVEHFPHDLQEEIRKLNHEFIKEQRGNQKTKSKDEKEKPVQKARSRRTEKSNMTQKIDIAGSSGITIIQVGRDADSSTPKE
ncbi:MAG: deaminase [Nitrospiraceae bacterium]|nr:deaminase [Nitrospiraceae bacterium]